jgi:hypothetical protein
LLRVVSALVALLLLGISIAGFFVSQDLIPRLVMIVSPLALIAGFALTSIFSYRVEPGAVLIRRPLWTTRLPLSGLQFVENEPRAMHRSLRVFGNGGVFSITGWYWNKRLGRYRAFVTDLNRCVVLRFADRRVVLSPDRPEDFIQALKRAL